MMWLREKVMSWLVYAMWSKWCSEDLHRWLKNAHEQLLADQMRARRAAGVKEVAMGIYPMSEKELDEHSRRF